MSRLFTKTQAEAVLPLVETAVREAIEIKHFYTEAEKVLQDESRRIHMSGGAMVNTARLEAEKSRRDTCADQLQKSLDKIHAYGCEVKDLDIGLLDFRTLYRGEEVYLCWRLGETEIEYWHGLSEGFRGRKKIDAEFLTNHRGTLVS